MTTKILAFTGIRSDYDLLSGVYRALLHHPAFDIGLIVSGAHLSPTYGMSINNILSDGIPIIARIESLIDSDTSSARLKSASILLQGCLPSIESYDPDLIMFAGDREDVIIGALAGAYLRIPTLHFFGGDHAVDGNVDNLVRHATSKLSSFHFVSHPRHAERLKCMGENPERIRVVGNPALDRFVQAPGLDKAEVLAHFKAEEWHDYVLVIYHPILGEEDRAGEHFEQVLRAISSLGLHAIVNSPNVDAGNRSILDIMEKWKQNGDFRFFRNLPSTLFTNLMRHASIMVGNSSAGLLEAPMVPLAVVNVGSRQRGRLAAANVIFVEQDQDAIETGILEALSSRFQNQLTSVTSPYGDGNSVDKVIAELEGLPIHALSYKAEDPLS